MNSNVQKESHARSILKGLTWRVFATATTIAAAYLITGETSAALKIGAIEFIAKILLYYFHERAWQVVPRGSIRAMLKLRK